MKKNLPKEITTYRVDLERCTIAAVPRCRTDVCWQLGEDIFKMITILCIGLSLLPLIYYHIVGTMWCLHIGLLFLTIAGSCIISYLISAPIVENRIWAKQITLASSIQAEVAKAIYEASVAEIKIKLEEIRNKNITTFAENEFYCKYSEFLYSDKVDYLPIPMWSWLFERH